MSLSCFISRFPRSFGFLFSFKYKFIYLLAVGSLLLYGLFSSCRELGLLSSCGTWALHCGGFSCCIAQALGTQASAVVAHGLQQLWLVVSGAQLSSCSTWAQLLRGEGDPSGPGIELISPALAGGFSTTEPPGKPWIFILMLGHFRKIRDKLFSQSRYNQSWLYFRDIAF